MSPRGLSVLGGMTADRFLSEYWQRKPLVIRNAFPALKDPLSIDELAGLACEAHVDSRLIVQGKGRDAWKVSRGPQRAETLRRLPRSRWTLLIESLDRHSDDIAALAAPFSFLPGWRMDDVMVSLSPLGGTVDAHIDSYDVFLIQGQGRRKWDVDSKAKPEYRPGIDLRILKRYRPESEWIMEPGDVLYVPPGCGHRGVTVASDADVALTYSVGFRAPSSADLMSTVLAHALASETPKLFADAGRRAVADPTEIVAADLSKLRDFLTSSIGELNPDEWALASGEAVTAGGQASAGSSRENAKSVVARLSKGRTLAPSPASRLSWTRLSAGRAALFVNGESRVFPKVHAFAPPAFCGRASVDAYRRLGQNADLLALTVDLLRAGVIGWR